MINYFYLINDFLYNLELPNVLFWPIIFNDDYSSILNMVFDKLFKIIDFISNIWFIIIFL
jgi:hypothetical protein